MDHEGRICKVWRAADGERQGTLALARECAALTKPWILPPLGQSEDGKMPEAFTSMGAMGTTNLEGKLLSSLYQTGWFSLSLAPAIEFAPDNVVSPKQKQAEKQNLFLRELQIQATLESAGVMTKGRRRVTGFRTNKRQALAQCLITGDVLERMLPDYRMQVYRRDQYVTKRDSAGDVIYHAIKESVDPLSLSEAQFAKTGLDMAKLKGQQASERMVDLWTMTEYQPWSKKWTVCQEVNGEEITEYDEDYSQFFSTPFELPPTFNYGRGWVELNLAGLRTLNELEMRLLDFAAIASDLKWAIDPSSKITDRELMQRSGSIIRTRTQAGVPQDIGMIRAEKLSDFKVVFDTRESVSRSLGRAMLLQTESAPSGEAGRSPVAWNQIAAELEGGLGGFYSAIADSQQVPLLERTVYQMIRDRLMPPFPEGAVRYSVMTGLAAIQRSQLQRNIFTFSQAIQAFGPAGMAAINEGVLIDILARYSSIYEPGLIKSPEQRAAEQQAAINAQAQVDANKQAAATAGGVVQSAADAALQRTQ